MVAPSVVGALGYAKYGRSGGKKAVRTATAVDSKLDAVSSSAAKDPTPEKNEVA